MEDEEIEVLHIPSEEMKADHLTKTVDAVKIKNCLSDSHREGSIDGAPVLQAAQNSTTTSGSDACPVATRSFVHTSTTNSSDPRKLVRFLLMEDRRITYQQLDKNVGIGSAAINTIINDHLKYRKLVSRWVPHSLTEDQKLGRVKWCNFMFKILMKANQRLFLILLQVTKLKQT
ncbi:hypothetical protein LAZ67_23001579 [Cordylochernes scorpioides]|uniref:Uncharacterized protein n=1 Tax=Cordylochernes scorpioides TaxID=51811 RepID=A0ABY6LTD2_9ARAC|nr:hypothetical protein LAZ67_23001579 [Cordylochernes scorpioides]